MKRHLKALLAAVGYALVLIATWNALDFMMNSDVHPMWYGIPIMVVYCVAAGYWITQRRTND